MLLTANFYLTAVAERMWIKTSPETVSLTSDNVQSIPLDIRFLEGEGSSAVPFNAYFTLRVESVVGDSVTVLHELVSIILVNRSDYTIPQGRFATANRITILAHSDKDRKVEIASKQVNIIAANPVPYPRPESWSDTLTYRNGEYLMQDDVLYMWTSRVPGNTALDPKTWIEQNPDSGLWTPYPYNTLLATQVLLTKVALIGSAVFQGDYMMSQMGVDAAGEPTNDYREFGTGAFTPNVLIDFLEGLFKGRNVEVDGGVFKNIKSPNESFKINENGDVELVGKVSTSVNGTRIVIDPETKSIRLFNQSDNEVGRLSFYEEEYEGDIVYRPRLRLSTYYRNEMQSDIGIESTAIHITRFIGSDVYDLGIEPTTGIVFSKNYAVTKKYPAS